MNRLEQSMLEALMDLKDNYGALGVKAEFEAEGTRLDELYRLIEIARKADLKLAIKIGGCEAIKDILDCKQVGVDYLIAPMIESQYALEKFGDSLKRTYKQDDSLPKALFNLETKNGYAYSNKLAECAASRTEISGIVFGRVDYCLSNEYTRDEIDSDKVKDDCVEIAKLCADHKLEFVVGGGVSKYSIDFLKQIRAIKLNRFETRKVIFDEKSLDNDDIGRGMLKAVRFELLWLMNKKNYYSSVGVEDDERIKMLESRWKILSESDKE